MIQKKTIRLFVFLVFVLPVTTYLLLSWYEKNLKSLPVYGNESISDFQFTSQVGEKITGKNWENKIVVANFFFTHCPVICPKMTTNVKRVFQVFENDEELIITSFTVDPERDDVAQLKKYSDRFQINAEKWKLLTGDKKALYRFARNDLKIAATDGDGGPNDFIHSEKLVLIDKNKKIRGFYTGTDEKEIKQLIKDIKRLKNEK